MMQLDLLAAPSARRFDPQTSRDAAESARELAARHHRIILDALSRWPAGKDRIAALTSLSGVQVARRTCELHRAGYSVEDAARLRLSGIPGHYVSLKA